MKNLKELPNYEMPLFTFRPCQYCDHVFFGKQATCVLCRTALKFGKTIITSTEDSEDLINKVFKTKKHRVVTREEVLGMRKHLSVELIDPPKHKEKLKRGPKPGSSRRLITAPALKAASSSGEISFVINQNLAPDEIKKKLRAAAKLFKPTDQSEYVLNISILKVGVIQGEH